MYDYAPNDVVLYESVFRHYRNAVVDHFRTCLTVSYGVAASDRLQACFGGTTWQDVRDKAQSSEARGVVQRPRVDDFDFLDVGLLAQVVEHHYEDLVPPQWVGAHAKSSKRQLLQWMQEVKSARDPAAHPGSIDADIADVIRTVDTAHRVLRRLGTKEGTEALASCLTALYERASRSVEIASVAPLDDLLPAAETVVENFVGRGDELQQLRAWLRHPHKNRWMLVGDGGKGKSAIAYAFAKEVLEVAPKGLCGTFWLSAKRRKYEQDQVVDIATPDFSTLSECLDRILIAYGHHPALGLPPLERQEQVLSLLDELPCLLIIDDLDSVDEESEDVVEFLTLDVPRTASKVLLTSRRKFAGMGSTLTRVQGLRRDDARAFVDQRWTYTGLDAHALTENHRNRIVNVCEGSPLYMGDLLRLCGAAVRHSQADVQQVISDWAARDGDTVRRYALQREMDMLTAPARRVLEVLAVADRPMTLVELARVADMSEHNVANTLEELRQLYLLAAPALDEETPRSGIDGNLAVLVRAEVQGGPREKQIRNALDAVDGKGLTTTQQVETRDLARQARLLINASRVSEAEELIARALRRNPENAHLLAMLGMCYVAWTPRRNADARTQFQRAADLGYTDRGIYMAWSRIEGEMGDWGRAVSAAERGLALRPGDPMLLLASGKARKALAKQHVRALAEEKGEAEYDHADEQLELAIAAARRLRLGASDISLMFEAWTTSAHDQGRPKAVCYRLERWMAWRSSDRRIRPYMARHASECPTQVHG